MSSESIEEKYNIVKKPSEAGLREKEKVDYSGRMKDFVSWMDSIGKEPCKAEGYAYDTVRTTYGRIDQFHRWVWNHEDGYTMPPTQSHADKFMQEVARSDDFNNSSKAKFRKALKRYFKWREHTRGDEEWETELRFPHNNPKPRDYLTEEERKKIRRAALQFQSVPEQYDLPREEERDEVEQYLAQAFEVPKEDVGDEEWLRANSWRITTLVWVSLDAGLRPVEVRRANTHWVDTENQVLRIPMEESSKNEDNWKVALQTRTAEALERWLQERSQIPLYDDTDALWLTIPGNRWGNKPLKQLLMKLCRQAGIETANRSMSWYTIRHSVGTYMTREEGLAAAQAQLRHRSPTTTMKYDQAPLEDRVEALDRMG